MRFSDANYLKAFPREDKPKPSNVIVADSVIEEAEKQEPRKSVKESGLDSVIDEIQDEPDQEGDAVDGNE